MPTRQRHSWLCTKLLLFIIVINRIRSNVIRRKGYKKLTYTYWCNFSYQYNFNLSRKMNFGLINIHVLMSMIYMWFTRKKKNDERLKYKSYEFGLKIAFESATQIKWTI